MFTKSEKKVSLSYHDASKGSEINMRLMLKKVSRSYQQYKLTQPRRQRILPLIVSDPHTTPPEAYIELIFLWWCNFKC